MIDRLHRHLPFLVLSLFLLSFQFWGAGRVPFHPDESTYLFMSGDFETWLSAPLDLAFDPTQSPGIRDRYRAIDPPLTRYILGFSRRLAGLDPLPVDWDWSQTWRENKAAGALPTAGLLLAGRLGGIVLLPLATALLYLAGLRLGGRVAGLATAVEFGTNSLVLLHGRRAMAEGILLFGLALFLWSLANGRDRPWLIGLAAAVAVNAKHSALALLPVAGLALIWSSGRGKRSGRSVGRALLASALTFLIFTGLTNPFLWHDPLAALEYSAEARLDLLERQVDTLNGLAPGQVLESPGMRGVAAVANLFVLPPAYAEVGNYQQELSGGIAAYRAIPGHELLRGLIPGGFFLAFTLFGLTAASLRLRIAPPPLRRDLTLALLGGLALLAGWIALVPLAWQRYAVPLVPYVALWSGYGAGQLYRAAGLRPRGNPSASRPKAAEPVDLLEDRL